MYKYTGMTMRSAAMESIINQIVLDNHKDEVLNNDDFNRIACEIVEMHKSNSAGSVIGELLKSFEEEYVDVKLFDYEVVSSKGHIRVYY